MNAIALRQNRFHGLAQIVRFNWTFYAIAGAASAAAIVLATQLPTIRPLLLIGVATALYFVIEAGEPGVRVAQLRAGLHRVGRALCQGHRGAVPQRQQQAK